VKEKSGKIDCANAYQPAPPPLAPVTCTYVDGARARLKDLTTQNHDCPNQCCHCCVPHQARPTHVPPPEARSPSHAQATNTQGCAPTPRIHAPVATTPCINAKNAGYWLCMAMVSAHTLSVCTTGTANRQGRICDTVGHTPQRAWLNRRCYCGIYPAQGTWVEDNAKRRADKCYPQAPRESTVWIYDDGACSSMP
jgi:hypothetical protein